MATRPRSARAAMAAAQNARRGARRVSELGAPAPQSTRQLSQAVKEGRRPQFAKGTSKAYQNSVMSQMRDARDTNRKVRGGTVHRKAQEHHAQVYAGLAAKNAARAGEANNKNRRAKPDRRA